MESSNSIPAPTSQPGLFRLDETNSLPMPPFWQAGLTQVLRRGVHLRINVVNIQGAQEIPLPSPEKWTSLLNGRLTQVYGTDVPVLLCGGAALQIITGCPSTDLDMISFVPHRNYALADKAHRSAWRDYLRESGIHFCNVSDAQLYAPFRNGRQWLHPDGSCRLLSFQGTFDNKFVNQSSLLCLSTADGVLIDPKTRRWTLCDGDQILPADRLAAAVDDVICEKYTIRTQILAKSTNSLVRLLQKANQGWEFDWLPWRLSVSYSEIFHPAFPRRLVTHLKEHRRNALARAGDVINFLHFNQTTPFDSHYRNALNKQFINTLCTHADELGLQPLLGLDILIKNKDADVPWAILTLVQGLVNVAWVTQQNQGLLIGGWVFTYQGFSGRLRRHASKLKIKQGDAITTLHLPRDSTVGDAMIRLLMNWDTAIQTLRDAGGTHLLDGLRKLLNIHHYPLDARGFQAILGDISAHLTRHHVLEAFDYFPGSLSLFSSRLEILRKSGALTNNSLLQLAANDFKNVASLLRLTDNEQDTALRTALGHLHLRCQEQSVLPDLLTFKNLLDDMQTVFSYKGVGDARLKALIAPCCHALVSPFLQPSAPMAVDSATTASLWQIFLSLKEHNALTEAQQIPYIRFLMWTFSGKVGEISYGGVLAILSHSTEGHGKTALKILDVLSQSKDPDHLRFLIEYYQGQVRRQSFSLQMHGPSLALLIRNAAEYRQLDWPVAYLMVRLGDHKNASFLKSFIAKYGDDLAKLLTASSLRALEQASGDVKRRIVAINLHRLHANCKAEAALPQSVQVLLSLLASTVNSDQTADQVRRLTLLLLERRVKVQPQELATLVRYALSLKAALEEEVTETAEKILDLLTRNIDTEQFTSFLDRYLNEIARLFVEKSSLTAKQRGYLLLRDHVQNLALRHRNTQTDIADKIRSWDAISWGADSTSAARHFATFVTTTLNRPLDQMDCVKTLLDMLSLLDLLSEASPDKETKENDSTASSEPEMSWFGHDRTPSLRGFQKALSKTPEYLAESPNRLSSSAIECLTYIRKTLRVRREDLHRIYQDEEASLKQSDLADLVRLLLNRQSSETLKLSETLIDLCQSFLEPKRLLEILVETLEAKLALAQRMSMRVRYDQLATLLLRTLNYQKDNEIRLSSAQLELYSTSFKYLLHRHVVDAKKAREFLDILVRMTSTDHARRIVSDLTVYYIEHCLHVAPERYDDLLTLSSTLLHQPEIPLAMERICQMLAQRLPATWRSREGDDAKLQRFLQSLDDSAFLSRLPAAACHALLNAWAQTADGTAYTWAIKQLRGPLDAVLVTLMHWRDTVRSPAIAQIAANSAFDRLRSATKGSSRNHLLPAVSLLSQSRDPRQLHYALQLMHDNNLIQDCKALALSIDGLCRLLADPYSDRLIPFFTSMVSKLTKTKNPKILIPTQRLLQFCVDAHNPRFDQLLEQGIPDFLQSLLSRNNNSYQSILEPFNALVGPILLRTNDGLRKTLLTVLPKHLGNIIKPLEQDLRQESDLIETALKRSRDIRRDRVMIEPPLPIEEVARMIATRRQITPLTFTLCNSLFAKTMRHLSTVSSSYSSDIRLSMCQLLAESLDLGLHQNAPHQIDEDLVLILLANHQTPLFRLPGQNSFLGLLKHLVTCCMTQPTFKTKRMRDLLQAILGSLILKALTGPAETARSVATSINDILSHPFAPNCQLAQHLLYDDDPDLPPAPFANAVGADQCDNLITAIFALRGLVSQLGKLTSGSVGADLKRLVKLDSTKIWVAKNLKESSSAEKDYPANVLKRVNDILSLLNEEQLLRLVSDESCQMALSLIDTLHSIAVRAIEQARSVFKANGDRVEDLKGYLEFCKKQKTQKKMELVQLLDRCRLLSTATPAPLPRRAPKLESKRDPRPDRGDSKRRQD